MTANTAHRIAAENHIRAIREELRWLTDATDVATVGILMAELVDEARTQYRELTSQPVATPEHIALKRFGPQEAAPQAGEAFEPILDGTYTVSFPDGDYRTLKLTTQADDASFAPGKQVAYYLNGPDNWSNYKGFAFVDGHQAHMWRNAPKGKVSAALHILLSDREAMLQGLKGYAQQSGKCGLCGRKLTTPESIARGIGPECASRAGIL